MIIRFKHPKCDSDELIARYKKELDDLERSSYPKKPDRVSNGEATSIAFSKLYYDYSTDSLEGDLGKDYKDMVAAILV